jgi:hypothetical protein
MLSFAAAGFYALVVLSCFGAAYVSRAGRQQSWHFKIWVAVAVLFVALIVSRVFNLEEILRADLREWLQSEDMVDDRRSVQGVIIAGAIAAFAAAGLYAVYWVSRRIEGRRNIAVAIAGGGGIVMLILIALRTISLHAMDQLLYGPLKLNWVGDIGASAAVIAAAVYYTWLIRQPRPTVSKSTRSKRPRMR